MTDEERIAQIRARAKAGWQAYAHADDVVADINVLLEILVRRLPSVKPAAPSDWDAFARRLRGRVNRIRELEPRLPDYVTAALTVCADEAANIAKEIREGSG